MASLGDILRGALGGEYSMGRDLDEEERRQIEELRAQGIYVPQERKMSPFSYGAGTVNKQNLGAMRAAIQPEQARRMNELMVQRGRGSRDALAMEQQQRKAANDAAIREAARKRAIADQGRRRVLGGMPTTSREDRFRKSTPFGGQPMISKEDYVAGSTPQITPQQQDELAVLQRENMPSRIQEQSLSAAQTAGDTQALANQVTTLSLQDKRRVSELSAAVHEALPANYTQTLANKQVVSAELAVLLDVQRLKTQQKFGDQLAAKSVNKQLSALDLEMANLELTLEWLQSDEGRKHQSSGMHIAAIQKLKAELELTKAQTGYYKSKALTGNPSGSSLEGAIPKGMLTVPFVTP
tara:strand:- start:44 stop:1102 length:1059 start_codon:yes stop_codon:yes gene_type:complete